MDRQSNNLIEQNLICKKFNAPFYDFDESLKLGISLNVREGIMPIHTLHLYEWKPEIIKYLGLPPGWRFLIAPGYEDVWFDPNLVI